MYNDLVVVCHDSNVCLKTKCESLLLLRDCNHGHHTRKYDCKFENIPCPYR